MFSQTLKYLRSKKKVTQNEIAKYLNIKRQTYSAYERGLCYPDHNALMKLASFFDVSTDDLLGYQTPPASQKNQSIRTAIEDLNSHELSKVLEYIEFLKSQRK